MLTAIKGKVGVVGVGRVEEEVVLRRGFRFQDWIPSYSLRRLQDIREETLFGGLQG